MHVFYVRHYLCYSLDKQKRGKAAGPKYVFGYLKYSSVTNMLFDLGFPSFNILIHDQKEGFHLSLRECSNLLVSY